jgi:hypothetical protein
MRAISHFVCLVVLALLLMSCGETPMKPEESMEADLKAAGIKPGGESHSMGPPKADETKMQGR